ncbi:MAG: YbhB/YbcL family Raf kinase inhibitor-like protein [Ilumatobacteraceae bacterium]
MKRVRTTSVRRPWRSTVFASTAMLSLVALTGCSRDGRTLAPALPEQTESIAIAPVDTAASLEPSENFAVSGPWTEGADIDLTYTCYGRSVSPPLQITGQPAGTVSLAVLLHDVETPERLLWTMANLSGGTVAIGEGATPPDVVIATNSDGNAGYAAPCPASGERRQYLLTVFALDNLVETGALINTDGTIDAEALLTEIEMGTFDLAESTFYVQAP